MKIGLLLIATNKYKQFIGPLLNSVKENFFVEDEVYPFLFTDRIDYLHPAIYIKIPSLRFPDATLKRYHIFDEFRDRLKDVDYLFYMDIDSLVVGKVGREILPDGPKHLTVCRHPGFWKGGGSWETRRESMFYVKPYKRTLYVAGGFNGAETIRFLRLSRELKENIDKDLKRGITPVWHDESALNWYITTTTLLKVLTPSYIYPEEKPDWFDWPEPPIILALHKNHDEIRK